MSSLTFPIAAIVALAEHAKAATNHSAGYGEEPSGPAIIIVGDRGIYMMSNGMPGIPRTDGKEGQHVVYADQCDPDKNPGWYDLKRATFGGDDGVEFLPIVEQILAKKDKGFTHVRIDFTANQIAMEFVTRGRKKKAA